MAVAVADHTSEAVAAVVAVVAHTTEAVAGSVAALVGPAPVAAGATVAQGTDSMTLRPLSPHQAAAAWGRAAPVAAAHSQPQGKDTWPAPFVARSAVASSPTVQPEALSATDTVDTTLA